MNWDDVRIFVAVARAGQILSAAQRLGMNHATVARRINALEEALGVRLFDRSPSGSILTLDGEQFLKRAEKMETEARLGEAELSGSMPEITGTVRIGAPDGFGVAYLAPRLKLLTKKHPHLKIQLVPMPRSFSLSRREADIAITIDRPETGRLIARKLVDYSLGLYASRSYLKENNAPQAPSCLTDHNLIGYVEDLIYSRSLNYGEEIFKDWNATIEIGSALGQLEAVRSGAGVGILHDFIAEEDDNLVALLPEKKIQRAYWMVTHETSRQLRHVPTVREFLVEQVEKDRSIFKLTP